MQLLRVFIVNIFDVEIDGSQFVSEDSLDMEKIICHPLIFTNLLYCHIWKYCYGTFPTKKDFAAFVDEHKVNLHSEEPINGKLLEKVVNSFFALKLGYLSSIDTGHLCKYVEELAAKKTNVAFLQDFVYAKWRWRFGSDKVYTGNMLQVFIQYYKDYKERSIKLVEDPHVNPLTGSYNETIELTELDDETMTEYEKAQYIIYQDCNFMAKCIGNACLVLRTPMDIEKLKPALINFTDKHPIIFSNEVLTNMDPYFCLKFHEDLYRMIPRLFKVCLFVDSKRHPECSGVSDRHGKSIYIIPGKTFEENTKRELDNEYDRVIVNDMLVHAKLNSNAFIIPRCYKDYGKNPQNRIHRRIIIGMKTYESHKTVIDQFCASKSIDCTIPRPEDFKGDFLIDMFNEVDELEYTCNGFVCILRERRPFVTEAINGFYVTSIESALETVEKLYKDLFVLDQFKTNAKMIQVIHSEDLAGHLWKEHLNLMNPGKDYNMVNNILLYYNFLVIYYEKSLEKIASIKMDSSCDSENKVVLIDNRPGILSVMSILMTLCNLKKDTWKCVVYTSDAGVAFYQHWVGRFAEIKVISTLNAKKFHIDLYNDILKSASFWRGLDCKKCLIIQDDGVIFREGVEEFLEYDYVGAPWADVPGNEYLKNKVNTQMVGNGGLSLRSVDAMIKITEKYEKEKKMLFYKNINYIPEDVYFCMGLVKEGASMPSLEKAVTFSSEQICHLGSLGVHKLWAYHHPNVVQKYFQSVFS
jgi:hypothetical protein